MKQLRGIRNRNREDTLRVKQAHDQRIPPTRLREMLSDRFGASEAITSSGIKLARVAQEEERAIDVLVAEAVLELADDLRSTAQRVTSPG
ncbi:MAG TPA: hypothetical protein VGC13_17615 [Longimicrobium sp.]|uniref:hypothetical protein n=1 Tax=Longimicrobium sp. TaxID=2029185 RepID=UPI002ED8F39E